MFIITKKITSGTLKGLVIEDKSPVEFPVGFVSKKNAWCGPGYVVLACVPETKCG